MSTALLHAASDPEQRRLGIGGSDIAAIAGLSPYATPLDLYLEKRGLWVNEAAGEAAYWGTVMEPVLAREFVRRSGHTLIRHFPQMRADGVIYLHDGEVVDEEYTGPHAPLLGTLTHPKYPWARAHLDGVVLSPAGTPQGVWEGKTASEYLKGYWGEPGTDQVPEAYFVQVQWGMWLADLGEAYVSPLIGGNRFGEYVVPRDEAIIAGLIALAAEFWKRVEECNPPDPEPGERGKESLSRLYPKGTQGKVLDAEEAPTLRNLAYERYRYAEMAKDAAQRKMSVENDIKKVMADATRLELGPKSYITWQNNRDSKVTDWEAAFRDLANVLALKSPELHTEVVASIYDQHTTTVPGPRVFRCQGLDKLEI